MQNHVDVTSWMVIDMKMVYMLSEKLLVTSSMLAPFSPAAFLFPLALISVLVFIIVQLF